MERREFLGALGAAAVAPVADWTHADRRLLARLLQEKQNRERSLLRRYFPDCTPECRPNSRNPEDHAGNCPRPVSEAHAVLHGRRPPR